MKAKTHSNTEHKYTVFCPDCMTPVGGEDLSQMWLALDRHLLVHEQAEAVALVLANAIKSLAPTRDMHGNYVPETWN